MVSEVQTVKGKVIKENIELWDKTYPDGPKNYHASQGVVDFVVTPNVLSWVTQGLVELYKGSGEAKAKEEKADDSNVANSTKTVDNKDSEVVNKEATVEKDDKEVKKKSTKKKSSKKKG